jgi:FtsZ-interacting cell division protein ZipA
MVRWRKKGEKVMKKSLLLWGALVIVALCFVGCCYYNTTNNHHCAKCCKHTPCCAQSGKTCPDSQNAADADNEVETVTVEAVELIPDNQPAAQQNTAVPQKTAAPAAKTPAAGK